MSRKVRIGNLHIGGGEPVRIQSMTNTITTDVSATVSQINELVKAGCEIIRAAVPDMESVKALAEIKKQCSIPLVADIHFDYRIAVECCGIADKIRINPGNIGGEDKLIEVLKAAKENNTTIRIGVNAGSLEPHLRKDLRPTHEKMVESALKYIEFCEKQGFEDIVVSLKSSNTKECVDAYKLFSKRSDYPLHLGVTEAGGGEEGVIKSSIGLGTMLIQGIGDTIRVSLTDNSVREIEVGKKILQACGLRSFGAEFVSCPTCARKNIDVIRTVGQVKEKLKDFDRPITIAIMGCEVNGPGEAATADIGLAAGKDKILLFKKGKVLKPLSKDNFIDEFVDEIRSMS